MEAINSIILPRRSRGRGTVRRTVEARALARVKADIRQHPLQIPQHLGRRNPQRSDALFHDPRVAPYVTRRPRSTVVRLPIHLDAKLGGVAIEVERVGPRRMLLAPMEARLPPPKLLPQQNFRKAHLAPESFGLALGFSCSYEHETRSRPRFARPSTMLRMVPLPQQAGGGICRPL